MFVASALTNSASSTQPIQVRTSADFSTLVGQTILSAQAETKKALKEYLPEAYAISAHAVDLGVQDKTNKGYAPVFVALRDWAKHVGAPNTAAQVIAAADWYWRNVEEPGAAPTKSAPQLPQAPPPQLEETSEPIYKKTWFLPVLIGLAAVGAGAAILYWPSND